MTQMGLPLAWPAYDYDEQFIMTASNRQAVQFLESWGRWPVAAALLTGPRKSGRSLLGRIFVRKSGGTLIDDAVLRDEEEVFHAWNAAQDARKPLLIIADAPPPIWQIKLPDLASRLAATPSVSIGAPDEDMLRLLFAKLFEQRRVSVTADVLRYLSTRIERSYISVMRSADALNEIALSQNRAITIPLAKAALNTIGVMSHENHYS